MLEDGDNFIRYFDQIVLLAKQLTSTPVYNPVQPSTRSGRLSTMILRFSRLTLAVLSIRGTYETNILMKSGNRLSFVLYHTWYDAHSIPRMINFSIDNWIAELREGNTPDWALDMWHPWEKVSPFNGIMWITSQYTGSAHGLLWQPREAEGRVWGILREVAEKEMGSRDSRDNHKHHLSVVLVKNTYCPLLSNCCGDSLDIEMKRSLPDMKKGVSVSACDWLSYWWYGRRSGRMEIFGKVWIYLGGNCLTIMFLFVREE